MVGNSYGIYIMLFFYYWPFYLPILVKSAEEERKREKEKERENWRLYLILISCPFFMFMFLVFFILILLFLALVHLLSYSSVLFFFIFSPAAGKWDIYLYGKEREKGQEKMGIFNFFSSISSVLIFKMYPCLHVYL